MEDVVIDQVDVQLIAASGALPFHFPLLSQSPRRPLADLVSLTSDQRS